MDNARYHRKKRLEELAAKAKLRLEFLPAYSPDYNPIEKSWANKKRYLPDNTNDFDSVELAVDYFFFHFQLFMLKFYNKEVSCGYR